jgi:hypothetical protein
MAEAEGFRYEDLINEILNLALDRYGQAEAIGREPVGLFQGASLEMAIPAWDGL